MKVEMTGRDEGCERSATLRADVLMLKAILQIVVRIPDGFHFFREAQKERDQIARRNKALKMLHSF